MAITPFRSSTDPVERLFDSLLGMTGGGIHGGTLMRAPETDVIETEREIRVVTEMPGLESDAIEVDVENNVLTIRGEKREQREEGEKGRYHLAERRYGTFTRSFVLPSDVEAGGIEANFDNGVLTVRIPKSERALRRRIEVGGEVGRGRGRINRGGQGQGGREGYQAQGGQTQGGQGQGGREGFQAQGGQSQGNRENRP